MKHKKVSEALEDLRAVLDERGKFVAAVRAMGAEGRAKKNRADFLRLGGLSDLAARAKLGEISMDEVDAARDQLVALQADLEGLPGALSRLRGRMKSFNPQLAAATTALVEALQQAVDRKRSELLGDFKKFTDELLGPIREIRDSDPTGQPFGRQIEASVPMFRFVHEGLAYAHLVREGGGVRQLLADGSWVDYHSGAAHAARKARELEGFRKPAERVQAGRPPAVIR